MSGFVGYKIHGAGNRGGGGFITVPAAMGRGVPAGARFKPEFVPEGILYRFVGIDDSKERSHDKPVVTPEWAGSE